MIRVVFFLIFVGIVALGAGWIADRPGGVEIVWLNYRISTSVAVLIAAIVLLMAVVMALWSAISALIRSPGRVSQYFRLRRITRGQHAITRGFIAIASGDAQAAARYSSDAKRLASDNPLTLLLTAQSAQLSGDHIGAERAFEQMAARPDLKAIGLHGMFIEARNRNDAVAAHALAEEAVKSAPSLGWAGQAALEFRCASGDWAGAIAALERNRVNGLIDKARYRRERAVLLTAQAQNVAAHDRDAAKALVLEAAKLAPDLVPAAAMAGRFHADAADTRKASRVLDAAWKANPHPDLADIYINLKPGDSSRDRLARAQKLAKLKPGNVEGVLALAHAAIEAQAFTTARKTLAPLLTAPTQRVAMLMAELEEAEHNDIGRARAWTARAVRAARDPAWTADGFVSDVWMPVSPATGRLDAFEWKLPVAELPGAVIEDDDFIEAEPPAESAPPVVEVSTAPAPVVSEPARKAAPALRTTQVSRPVETVIPLVHAPDDPGPGPAEDVAPEAIPQADGWRKLLGIFR